MTERLTSLWQQRYRAAPPADLANTDVARTDVFASLLAHRSVRAYLPDALPEGTVEAAIAAAQSAASSSNLQAWSVVAVEDPARRAHLATLCGNQSHITQAPLFLVWLADLSRLERIATRAGKAFEALDYTETFMIGCIDAALAAQNAVAALEAAGLGTVYIGGLRNHPEKIAEALDLPPRSVGLFGLCVGKPDPSRPAQVKPRLPQQAVLHREQYDHSQEAALVGTQDHNDNAFQEEQGLAPRLWSTTVSTRIAGAESLGGRDGMKDSLRARGFVLK